MSLTKRYARQIVADNLSLQRGIPVEAAEDLLDHVQEIIYDHRGGMGEYKSEYDILTDYGIPIEFAFIFD